MNKPVVQVQVRAVATTSGSCAAFLGNEGKVLVICIEQSVGAAIAMFMQGTKAFSSYAILTGRRWISSLSRTDHSELPADIRYLTGSLTLPNMNQNLIEIVRKILRLDSEARLVASGHQ
jgi:hypothetical protein